MRVVAGDGSTLVVCMHEYLHEAPNNIWIGTSEQENL